MACIQTKEGKNGKTYYIVYSYQEADRWGQRKNKVKWLKAGKTKTEAKLALQEFNKQYKEKRHSFNTNKNILFQEFINLQFLPWCKPRKSEDGNRATTRSLNYFLMLYPSINIQDIGIQHIEQFMTWRKEAQIHGKIPRNRTINIDLTYISQCLKKAKEWGIISENPCQFVKKLKETRNRVRFFSNDEVHRLLENANPYIKRFLVVGICTGMRCSELLNLKINQIDLPNNVIHITNDTTFQTKSRKNRDVPICNILRDHLDDYMNHWADSKDLTIKPRTTKQSLYLFCHANGERIKSFKGAFGRLLKRTEMDNASIHTMRHTFASHLVMNGTSIRTVQELMGHSSIGVTEMSAYLTNQHKQEAIQALVY